jgi:hypothetical protein
MNNKQAASRTEIGVQGSRVLRSFSGGGGQKLDRADFLRIIVRMTLFLLLAIITFTLSSRVVSGKNCSSCPVNGTCKGKSDCTYNQGN